MSSSPSIKVGRLKAAEVREADRIMKLAFCEFLNISNPLEFMGDRNFVIPRWHSTNVKIIAARESGRLIGSNVVTSWGSFGFFGPLTVMPEYWGHGVAQQLMKATTKLFDKWSVRKSGLFTFPQSIKHVHLYQKFGYWPGYLTAVMTRRAEAQSSKAIRQPELLSNFAKPIREELIKACAKLTDEIDAGLTLEGEIRSVLKQQTGNVLLTRSRNSLDAFAICHHGPGSEGGEKTCYIKFGAARRGSGASDRFERLLDACEAYASSVQATLEAGVNLAREDAFRRMSLRGYRVTTQGVAMQRPHTQGHNRAGVYVINDWR